MSQIEFLNRKYIGEHSTAFQRKACTLWMNTYCVISLYLNQ